MHVGDDILAVNDELALLACRAAQRGVQDGAVLGGVDVLAAKSTTIPILGDNGRMIAMLCINFHTDIPMATFLSGFFPAGSPSPLPQRSETFSDNVDHFIHAALDQAKATVFADPRISSVNRNKEIIRLVHEQGIFKRKNAVPKVAQELGVSKNTVYLHLRSLKNADHAEA